MEPNQELPPQNEPNQPTPTQQPIEQMSPQLEPQPVATTRLQPTETEQQTNPIQGIDSANHLSEHKKFISRKLALCFFAIIIICTIIGAVYVFGVQQSDNSKKAAENSTSTNGSTDNSAKNTLETRDKQRKDDLLRLQVALTQYQSNNRGEVPSDIGTGTNWEKMIDRYILTEDDSDFSDPLGNQYIVSDTATLPKDFDMSNPIILANIGYTCSDQTITKVDSTKKVAFQMRLEDNTIYCINN